MNCKGSGNKRKNSFVNGGSLNNNANNINAGRNSNNDKHDECNNGVSNGNDQNFGNNALIAGSLNNSSYVNNTSCNSNIRLCANDNIIKSFSGSSLLNLAANGNSSLDSIISLNDSEPGLINNNYNNLTLALNENSNIGYLGNNNHSKSKGISNNNNNINGILNNQNAISDEINNNNYFNHRMEALDDKLRKNSSCNSLSVNNKDKQQVLSLPDLDKKMSFCSFGSEAANKIVKSNSSHLELLNCLKQKELEILKAQKTYDRKKEEKMLSKILFIICL